MVDAATRWVQVMVFYILLIVILPMALTNNSVTSVEQMRIQMIHFFVCGLLYYFFGAWYIVNGDFDGYSLEKAVNFVDITSLFSL
tara:strand:- start:263 stop:517 length:255 start_codon:yes stop_codon:yes gene_type:complete